MSNPLASRAGTWSASGAAVSFVLILLLLLAACAEERTTTPGLNGDACVTCHTSKEALIASAAPEPPPSEDPGEG
jgi:hypothetical protein